MERTEEEEGKKKKERDCPGFTGPTRIEPQIRRQGRRKNRTEREAALMQLDQNRTAREENRKIRKTEGSCARGATKERHENREGESEGHHFHVAMQKKRPSQGGRLGGGEDRRKTRAQVRIQNRPLPFKKKTARSVPRGGKVFPLNHRSKRGEK